MPRHILYGLWRGVVAYFILMVIPTTCVTNVSSALRFLFVTNRYLRAEGGEILSCMYCRNCGAESQDRAVVCTKCGVLMGDGYNYCPNCGFQHDPKAVICVKCGHELKSVVKTNKGAVSRTTSSNIKNENVYTLPEAIKSCWNKYADFSGRACRAEYWFWSLFQFLIIILLAMFIGFTVDLDDDFSNIAIVLACIVYLILFLPSLAVCVRRLHDIGMSGWMYLIGLVPYIGGILLLIWCCQDSQKDNEYGTNPKSDRTEMSRW